MKTRMAENANIKENEIQKEIKKETGEEQKIAGILNGLATDETTFRDEFFTNAELHVPEGKTIMLLGLAVLPEYRGEGLARALMYRYLCRMVQKEKDMVLLTCLDSRVPMYEKMGFQDKGAANSTWGGEEWHEMNYPVGIGKLP